MNPDLVEAVARAIGETMMPTAMAHDAVSQDGRDLLNDLAQAAIKAHDEWLVEQGIDVQAQLADIEKDEQSFPTEAILPWRISGF